MGKSVKRTFYWRRAGFARADQQTGLSITADNPFVIFRDADDKWRVAHARSGLLVEKLLPPRLMRSKARLLLWLEEMARDMPEAVAMLGLVESADMMGSDDFAGYGQQLLDWSGSYVCI